MNDSSNDTEQLEREHEQLFHELRSIIPGVEVLFAFLLTVAFSERFEKLTAPQQAVYFATFVCAGLSLVLLLAPAAFHRVGHHDRNRAPTVGTGPPNRTANLSKRHPHFSRHIAVPMQLEAKLCQ